MRVGTKGHLKSYEILTGRGSSDQYPPKCHGSLEDRAESLGWRACAKIEHTCVRFTVNGAAESSPSRVRTHTSHPHILFFPAHHILPILLTSPHVERFISEQFSSEAALTLYPPKTDHKVTPIQKSFKTPQGQLTTTKKTITPHQSAGDP